MSQDDFFSQRPRKRPKRHINCWIAAERFDELEQLKKVNEEMVIEEIRRAVETTLERLHRRLTAIGGKASGT